MKRLLATAAIGAAVLLGPAGAEGQAVIGQLVDRGSGSPIAGGYVALLTELQDTVAETLADGEGRFVLEPEWGSAFFLRINAFGYRTVTDGIFDVGSADTLWLTARLSLEPITIGGIEVSTAGRRRGLLDAGFYRRMDTGFGRFLTPEEIERRAPSAVSDLFLNIPQIQLRPSQNGLSSTLAVRVGGQICYPSVFVDNLLAYRGRLATGGGPTLNDGDRALTLRTDRALDLDALLNVADIAALELYTGPSEVPLQYNVQGAGCGVLVIWTRRGRR